MRNRWTTRILGCTESQQAHLSDPPRPLSGPPKEPWPGETGANRRRCSAQVLPLTPPGGGAGLFSGAGGGGSQGLLAAEAPGLPQRVAPGLQSAGAGHGILQLLDDSEEQEEEQEEQEEEERQVEEQVEFPLHAAAAAARAAIGHFQPAGGGGGSGSGSASSSVPSRRAGAVRRPWHLQAGSSQHVPGSSGDHSEGSDQPSCLDALRIQNRRKQLLLLPWQESPLERAQFALASAPKRILPRLARTAL